MPQDVRPKKAAYLVTLAFCLVGGLLLAFSIVNLVNAASPEKYGDLSKGEVILPKGECSICYEDTEIRTYTTMPIFTATFTNIQTGAAYKSQLVSPRDYTVSRYSRGMEGAPGHGSRLEGRVLATVNIEQAGKYEITLDGIFTVDAQMGGFKLLAVRKNPVDLAPAVVMVVLSGVFFLGGILISSIVIHRKRKASLRRLFPQQQTATPAQPYGAYVLGGAAAGTVVQGQPANWSGPSGSYPAGAYSAPGQPAPDWQNTQMYGAPQGQPPIYPQPYPGQKVPVNPGTTGFLVWSIINTVFLFPVVLPILAWVQAAKARRAPTLELLQKHKRMCLIFNLSTYGLMFVVAVINGILPEMIH